MSARSLTDRRAGAAGDLRRTALLRALDEQLRQTDGDLDAVNVGDLTKQAGVTRPAFYFYFESKAAAVAAAADEMYGEVSTATSVLLGEGDPATRITRTLASLVRAGRDHRHLYRAMLQARNTSAEVRALWEADRRQFVAPIAAMITDERAAGRAAAGAPADALATMLLDLNERLLERLTFVTDADPTALTDAVAAIWLATIYGRTDLLHPSTHLTTQQGTPE
ncbi:TetR/AcrR family transcriptional regulator [Rhodococcus sp. X156]|uniref:TetR/AcrR family transcriptional regulator n=1 Tax=Rhodococcus sp. X156 TaxID=2499145 RepID=UPI000FDA0800|nr:TetR/AcrR family transcriptional regulator [Rhodococcus sp. X156]